MTYSADSTDKQKRVTYEKIVEMLEKDVPITKISKELDVARNTVYRIKKLIIWETICEYVSK